MTGPLAAQSQPNPAETDFVKETRFTYGPWRSSVMGGGGYVQNVVPCPGNPRRFYTYVDVGGLSRSDDGGVSWRMLHGALPPGYAHTEVRGLIVDPRNADRILVATGSPYGKGGGVFASDDAGVTFKKVLESQYAGNGGSRSQGFILARSAQNPDRVVTAGIGTGVHLSNDNGATWTAIGMADVYPTDVRFDRTNPNRIWLCTSSEKWKEKKHEKSFHRTDDGGATWRKLSDGEAPSEIVQDPKNAAELFGIFNAEIIKKSSDAGETWVPFSEGLPIQPLSKGQFKESISPTGYRAITAGPDFLLTGPTKGGQLYKLVSGGSRWEKIEGRQEPVDGDWFHHGGGTMGWALGSITVDPKDPAHWFITDYFAIYQTRDAGRNWRLTIDGIETTVAHCVLQDPTDPGVIHVGVADVGAFTSVNGGIRLRRNEVPHLGPDRAGGGNMKCMDLNPKLPGRIYGVANRNHYNGWRADQIYVSTDRGETWYRSPMTGLPDLAKNPATTITADQNDPYTVYLTVSGKLGAPGGVYKSTDGGASWVSMSAGLPDGQYCFPYDIWAHGRQLAAGTDGTLIALNISGNRIYRFDPKPQKWETTSLRGKGGRLWSVVADRLKPGRFFVGVRGDGLYRTEDSGATWQRVYDQSVSFVATDSAVVGRVAGATLNGVILSKDGGTTWETLDQSLPYRHDNIPGFSGERLVVGSLGNGVFWMPLSPQGEQPVQARPFTPVPPVPPLASSLPLPKIENAGFDSPNNEGWTVKTTSGAAVLTRDTTTKRSGPSSLKIDLTDAVSGSLYQDLTLARRLFSLTGVIRVQGSPKNVRLLIESLDAQGRSLGVFPVTNLRTSGTGWNEFYQGFALPRVTARARLSLQFEGTGSLWLDNFRVRDGEPGFPE
ncbi:MAG TPA: hypothetical protein VIO38_09815 [Rariglobus sp.]